MAERAYSGPDPDRLSREISELPPTPTSKAPNSQGADQNRLRCIQALQLRMGGLSYAQVGEAMGVGTNAARDMIKRALNRAEKVAASDLRALENERLDRLQAAIWTKALNGDLQAVDRVLRISERRARLNGLDAPSSVNISVGVRAEMEQAMQELQTVIMGEVVEEADGDDDSDAGAGA